MKNRSTPHTVISTLCLAVLSVCALIVQETRAQTSEPPHQLSMGADQAGRPLTLWYLQPARQWVEASVIGNGRLGGMVWGGVALERIDLNEDTLWSGEPFDNVNPKGLAALPNVRALLVAGKHAEAKQLVEQKMNGRYNQSYQPLGDLQISFPLIGEVANYRRDLDLETAVARTTFVHDGTTFVREVFASNPGQAIIVRLTSDKPNKVAFTAQLHSQLRSSTKADGKALRLTGRTPAHVEPNYNGGKVIYDDAPEGKGMRFETRLTAVNDGGSVKVTDTGIVAESCNSVTLLLVAATSYDGPHKSPSREGKDPRKLCDDYWAALAGQSFASLRDAHIADHRGLFGRVALDLGHSDAELLPTDVRLKRYSAATDPGLPALYFQFGRYLLIAGSRPGTQPLNLQGIWNKDIVPPWSANWTLNCNAQINYWPVEVANLAECHEPLIDLTTQLSVDGAHVAKNLYGARGWMAHHNTDIWRQAGPVSGNALWSIFQVGGTWLCQHVWEHYAFSGDKEYLRRVWPVLAGAARYHLDSMIEEPTHHWLVTAPDTNFENDFLKPNGERGSTCMGPTGSMQMVRELFQNCLAGGTVLGVDAALRAEIAKALPRLAPMQISPTTGELQEWVEDWRRTAECQVLSSWGAICSAQITPRGTPELAAGVRKIFDGAAWWKKGFVGSWQGAFQANVYARLHDGDTAMAVLETHLKTTPNPNLFARFNPHCDFEIDGNMGNTAAVAEMLLQSQTGEIELLPALPKVWPTGSFRGLRARGGFTVDCTWHEGRLTGVTIYSKQGGACRVRSRDKVITLDTKAGQNYRLNGELEPMGELSRVADRLSPAAFAEPPVHVRPGAFWDWLNGSVTREQITRDLEAMKRGGMRGGEIWDVAACVDPDRRVPAGPAFLGPESAALIAHAIREADRLGLEIGLVASSGWNAGGGWVTPEYAGKGLYHSTTRVVGLKAFHAKLPLPELPNLSPRDAQENPLYLRDVAVLAVPHDNAKTLAATDQVVDLTKKIDASGKLRWDVPAGDWDILRFVCVNHGQQLIVPSPRSGGPMIDFFDPRATEFHLQHIAGTLLKELGRTTFEGTSFKTMEFDSMELDGFVPWNEIMADEFQRRAGYSAIRFLPLLVGWKLADSNVQEQFIYDWQKVMSDQLIDSHYVTARKVLGSYGVKLIAEAGGPGAPIWDSNPVDAIKALGAVDIPRGEFWIKHREIFLVKEIASAAHVYNKRLVDAESFTTWRRWVDGPLDYKKIADRAFCEGLNCFTLHTFASSPPEAGLPGWAYHAGTDINPSATWWPMVRGLMDYLARCSYMLRQGWFVADVCYFYGDQAPNFYPPLCNVPEKPLLEGLSASYDYDVCSAEVILERMRVDKGRIVLPDGMSYAALVLPEQEHIPSEVLEKVRALVAQGATVIGHKRPNRAPNLKNNEEETRKVERWVEELWGRLESTEKQESEAVLIRTVEKGRFVIARDRSQALKELGVGGDFEIAGRAAGDLGPLDFIHRKTLDDDFYFVSNKTMEPQALTCRFRVSTETSGQVPEFWWPDSGRRSTCREWKSVTGGYVELPVNLGPQGSVFVVFRKAGISGSELPEPIARDTFTVAAAPAPLRLDGDWQVEFPEEWGAPRKTTFPKLQSWTESDTEGIRSFSGIATYRKTFELPHGLAEQKRLFIQLGDLAEIAEVTLNGKQLGLVWLPPYRVEISGAVRAGVNQLEIRVANLWANRLNADSLLAEKDRFTRSNLDRIQTDPTAERPYGKDSKGKTRPVYTKIPPLMKSGLLGPVQIVVPSDGQKPTIPESMKNMSFDPATTLWYEGPAKVWEEALPLGNGRLGAMVFGKNSEERIQLNEETYWSGGPYSTVVKGGYKALPEIQKMIFEGNPIGAHKLFGRQLMGYPVEQQKYQSIGNLYLFFENEKDVTGYTRWLDLKTGIASVEYTANGVKFKREVFSSAPDQVIVVRLTADKPRSISFKASLRGSRNKAHSNYASDYFRMDGVGQDGLMINGKSADYMGVTGALKYRVQLKAISEGGTVTVDDTELTAEKADAVTLYIAAATSFKNYKEVSADPVVRVAGHLAGVQGKTVEAIRDAAVTNYQGLFNRVRLELERTANSHLPTDKRMAAFETAPDPSLAALCYHFGRYLLISSSRPGTEAANLQGIWNEDMNPSWDSKYTANINLQMNYWPVESGNLSECAEPLTRLVKELTDQGARVAKEHYGAKGWVFHQNTDIWRVAAPMDGPTWGTFTVGGAWLCNQLWERYLYTLDQNYLEEIYPVIKGSVEFFMDFLVAHPNGKWLVTNPSNSPENPPKGPGYRYFCDEVTGNYYFTTICYGSTMDMQILSDLFGYFGEASRIVGADKELAAKVAASRVMLVPPQIGSNGTLQEWAEDYGQMEDKHRHFSHLYGLYPGNVLSARRTPKYVEAIKAVLEQRGDGGTGFSHAWKMALWARLYDGDRANRIFKGYIKEQACPQLFAKCFTSLQVDGSLGVAAGITEMLMQSHEGVIDLLPALPKEWREGRFKGVCARGAFELDMTWSGAKLTRVEVLSKAGQPCRIKAGSKVTVQAAGENIATRQLPDGSIEFATKKGVRYQVVDS